MASDGWFVKGRTRIVSKAIVDEEQRYVEENPHAEVLRERFALANVEYGRIDYGFVNGRLQVYEINTNPTIVGGRAGARKTGDQRRPKRRLLTSHLVEAFRDMDAKSPARSDAHAAIDVTPGAGPLPAWAYRGVRRAQSLLSLVTHRSGIR